PLAWMALYRISTELSKAAGCWHPYHRLRDFPNTSCQAWQLSAQLIQDCRGVKPIERRKRRREGHEGRPLVAISAILRNYQYLVLYDLCQLDEPVIGGHIASPEVGLWQFPNRKLVFA